jgi:hypothetical protein
MMAAMNALVRPHTKLAAALVAAGVVSAASVVSMPAHRGLPTISANIAYTSAVTDTLGDVGQGVEVLSSLVGIHVDATISLPFEATLAVLAAAQHPELSANVLSYLVQRFVNPTVGDPIHAYPFDTELTVARLADLLPYPLGPSATEPGLILDGGKIFGDVFNSVLGQLADPLPGFEAVNAVMDDTVLGGAIVAGHLAARAPMNMAWNSANYLGYLPANLEASLESAIQRPDEIPGLVSKLVHGLLSPDAQVGLFGKLLDNAVDPFTWLPAPIGYSSDAMVGLANQTRDAIAGVMSGVLTALPAPVTPSALPSGAGAELGPRGLPGAKGDEKGSDATTSNTRPRLSQSTDKVAASDSDAVAVAVAKVRPGKHEVDKVNTDKADTVKVDTDKADTVKVDTDKVGTDKADTVKAAPDKADAAEAKSSDGAHDSGEASAA